MTKGVLYIVATPIGNLADITKRAIDVLNSVDLIAAEDTRCSKILLNFYNIKTDCTSYHKFSEIEKSNILIEKLLNGINIALISDAGTPLISDPGNVLVKCAIKNNIKIVPVGGISAVTTFLSSISREDENFKFIGFLPKNEGQIIEIFKNNRNENLVFYESPKRIKETFDIILKFNFESIVSIGRELTKKFEEIKTDSIENIVKYYEMNPIKGEIVCMIHKTKDITDETILKEKILSLKNLGFSLKDIVNILNITDCANKNLVKKIYISL